VNGWITNTVKKPRQQRCKKTTRQLELHAFPLIGAKPIKDLKSSDILAMLKPLAGDNKVETAHRIRTLCSSIFNYAIVHNIVDYNPVIALARALPAIQVTHRAAITEPVRVGQLLRDIYSYQGTFVVTRALRLSALLMVRPGELRQAECSL
jgi:integrase